MLPVVRRIVATLAAQMPEAPHFVTTMKRLDELASSAAAAEAKKNAKKTLGSSLFVERRKPG